MAQIEVPDEFDDLKSWVENHENFLNTSKLENEELGKEVSKALDEERALRAQLQEIARRRIAIEDQQKALKDKARQSQVAIEAGKRKLSKFHEEAEFKRRLEEESSIFDEITAGLPWREWAFDYQIDGAKRLASAKRSILGDTRGLGKTLTSLITIDMLRAKKVIVFAPVDVLENFQREIKRWAPHRNVAILQGLTKTERGMFLSLLGTMDQWTLLVNYEAWRKDAGLVELLSGLCADSIVIDEAHNIKNRKALAYLGIKEIVYADNQCSSCGSSNLGNKKTSYGGFELTCLDCLNTPSKFNEFCSVKNVIPMTGTAILNKPQDLWTLLHIVDRAKFPVESQFLRDYCINDMYTGRWKFKTGGEERLLKSLGFMFVRRTKETAGVKTPPQVVVPHHIQFDKDMYPQQWKVMRQIQDYGAIRMAEDVKLDIVGLLPELMRRRQALVWPYGIKIFNKDENGKTIPGSVLYDCPVRESIKLDKAMEIATEIIEEDGDRLVIFSQFKEALKEMELRFQRAGITVVRYDGDISDAKARQAQLDFDGKTAPNHPEGTSCSESCKQWGTYCEGYSFQVILAHYKKGGVGLNLNAARQMIILDREWNPGKEDQAFGRIDRIDNTQDSIVHTIHVEKTIDNFMDSLMEEKAAMISGFETSSDTLDRLISAMRDSDLL